MYRSLPEGSYVYGTPNALQLDKRCRFNTAAFPRAESGTFSSWSVAVQLNMAVLTTAFVVLASDNRVSSHRRQGVIKTNALSAPCTASEFKNNYLIYRHISVCKQRTAFTTVNWHAVRNSIVVTQCCGRLSARQ